MQRRMRRATLWLLILLVLSNLALFASDRSVLVGKRFTNGWMVEGDMLFLTWDARLTHYRDKRPVRITNCTYWMGAGLRRLSLPSGMLPEGCPSGLFRPR